MAAKNDAVITVKFNLSDTYTDKFGHEFTVADFIDALSREDDEGEPTISPAALLHHLALYGGSRKLTLGRNATRQASGKAAARKYAPDLSKVTPGAVPADLVAKVEAFRAEVKPAPEPKPAKPAKVSAKDARIAANEARIKELEALFAAKVASEAKPAPKVTPITPVLSGKDPKVNDKIATARKAAKVAKKEEAAKVAGAPVVHRTDLTPATVASAPAIVPVKPAPKLPVTRQVKKADPVAPSATAAAPAGKVVEVTASGLVLESFDL